jgi:hypothetical protein
MVFTCPFGL